MPEATVARGRRAITIQMSPRSLFILPVATYLASYVHLALYHGRAWIWDTVVHEGGEYTLLETTLYASHFLGHVPVHTALALVFVGWHRMLSREPLPPARAPRHAWALAAAIVALLAGSYWLSLAMFGAEDTHDYITQSKQSVERLESGGSWKLHLPSTMMMLVVIPLTVIVCRSRCGTGIGLRRNGLGAVGAGIGLIGACTLVFDPTPLASLGEVWTDPRYLAHSVREIATFPLTYFAPAMALLLRDPVRSGDRFRFAGGSGPLALGLTAVFTATTAYQCWVPLSAGSIGEIAQKPDFAAGGELGIVYLLTSHYFEHFLDTVYFVALCLLLDGLIATRARR